MEQRKELEISQESSEWKKVRRGWCWGPKGFREEILELIAAKKGQQHYGEELKESDEQKAERLMKGMLGKAGRTAGDLKRRRKGDPKKARFAARLRAETPMSWLWIAKQWEMGHWRTASNAVLLALSTRRN